MTPTNSPAQALAAPGTSEESDIDVLARLLAGRYSCRAFRPEPLPRATIEQWLATAQRSASWCNTQPWRLAIASGAATERFREALLAEFEAGSTFTPDVPFPAVYEGIALARRRECGLQLYKSVGVGRGDEAGARRQLRENFRMFGAPHVAIISAERALGPYANVDVGLYLGTLMLAAQALGIGCIAQGALARYTPLVRRFFAIPEGFNVVCGLAFGRPDEAHPVNGFRTSRAGLADAVTWFDDHP